MNLFNINNHVAFLLDQCFDYETGEAIPEIWDQIEQLEIDRKEQLLDIACNLKEGRALEDLIKEQIKRLTIRLKREEARNNSIGNWLGSQIKDGEVIEDGRARISIRNSEETIIDCDIQDLIDISAGFGLEFMRKKLIYSKNTILPDKKNIKAYIEADNDIPGCYIKQNRNLQLQ